MPKLSKVTKSPVLWLVLVQWVIALEWLKSGLSKFTDGAYMADIGRTVNVMATNTRYGWFADVLKAADANVWGNVVRFSELSAGVVLVVGGLYILKQAKPNRGVVATLMCALYAGALLNLSFYLGAGWSSQAVVGINLVMGLTQAVLGSYYLSLLRKA